MKNKLINENFKNRIYNLLKILGINKNKVELYIDFNIVHHLEAQKKSEEEKNERN